MSCIACNGETTTFMDFGRMPLADAFLEPGRLGEEFFFDLAVARCPSCSLVQLAQPVAPERMFHASYAYASSISTAMERHFQAYANEVLERISKAHNPLVVEIGSNDGILLRYFAEHGVRHLGIEPSDNVAAMARARGVRTQTAFFDRAAASHVLSEEGTAAAIVAANVISHVPDLASTFEGVRNLLDPAGIFVFEEPYVVDILRTTALDQIYDEHCAYFSASAVARLARAHALELLDVAPQPTHGGSMRYVLGHAGRPPLGTVDAQIAAEHQFGLDAPGTYDAFNLRARQRAIEFRRLLEELHGAGKRICGYGATAKSCTMINFAGVDARLVECIYDTTPGKHGKLSPGAHIPIRPYEEFAREYPDYAVLFAWNHEAEIVAKESAFARSGGQWIAYVPDVRVWS